MNKFSTRIILATSLLSIGSVLLLGFVLISSSVGMMNDIVLEMSHGAVQLIATELEQKRDMRERILENIQRVQGDRVPHPKDIVPFKEPDRQGIVSSQRTNMKRALGEDLAELAGIMEASQIALILTDDLVVCATTDLPDEYLLDEAAILALWEQQKGLPANTIIEHRYPSSVAVIMNLDAEFMERNSGLLIQFPLSTLWEMLFDVATYVSLVVLLIACAAFICSIFLSRSISKPLSGLAEIVSRYSQGELEYDAPVAGPRETRLLGSAFNEMARSLDTHIEELQQETRRREQLETELRIAAQLQSSLLPAPGLYQSDGLQVLGWNEQAKEVGGDFYDYWPLDAHRTLVVIGDAAGKGITAAILAARCLSVIQTISERSTDPAEILRRANNALCRQFKQDGHFVTAFVALIDQETAKVTCSLAGHNPPFLQVDPSQPTERISSEAGLPLGVAEDTLFESLSWNLRDGSTLLLYTDGVTEAFGPDKQLYGEERLERVFAAHAAAALDDLLEKHQNDLADHRQGRTPNDDATFLLLRLG